jgi:diadenosine tetraphosphate (Ap4A) HIT family hydrolase
MIPQNNGKIAHQVVPHVHFHLIPKPLPAFSGDEPSQAELDKAGLVVGWPTQTISKEELKELHEELVKKLNA